ncbi:MAG TPA: hypothetical protein VGL83_17400 [Stellaceae bacterium]|jgi:hypothetical protein
MADRDEPAKAERMTELQERVTALFRDYVHAEGDGRFASRVLEAGRVLADVNGEFQKWQATALEALTRSAGG